MCETMRRKLTEEKREKKLAEWWKTYHKHHPTKAHWDLVADLDAETIAVPRDQAEQLIGILKEHKVTFWRLGPLGTVCSRPEHYGE